MWRAGGLDLLWRRDPAIWDATAPLLFPTVGWCRDGVMRIAGRPYPMPVHGFAAACDFAVHRESAEAARFTLRDDARTRAHYPFAFLFEARYALAPEALRIELSVTNAGAEPMPYACGLHPGFAWPFAGGARADYRVVFAQEERAFVPEIAPGGLFSARLRPVPLEGRRLALSEALFAREALCFLDAKSRSLSFERPGAAALDIETEGFPHWALWSRPGADFLCVEAWTGHGDPEGFAGDVADKPSMSWLAPGQTRVHAATFRLRLAPGPASAKTTADGRPSPATT